MYRKRISRTKGDLLGQILMLLPLLCLLIGPEPSYAMYSYLSVGFWQAFSAGAHFISYRNEESGERRTYRLIVFWTAAALSVLVVSSAVSANTMMSTIPGAVFNYVQGTLIIFLVLLLVLSPFLAVWYFRICLADLRYLTDAEHRRSSTDAFTRDEAAPENLRS